jgi:hypothetical protein
VSDPVTEGRIQTFSGLLVSPLDLRPEDVKLIDVATALGNICRFNGHCRFLSVAEHSINVALRIHEAGGGLALQLAGLLHDAAEAYLGDTVSPLKQQPSYAFVREAEDRADVAIAAALGLGVVTVDLMHSSLVRKADSDVLALEEGCGRRGGMAPDAATDWFMQYYVAIEREIASDDCR